MGLAAVNYLERGYERLEDGRMDHIIEQSTAYSDITIDVLQQSGNGSPPTLPPWATQRPSDDDLEKMTQYAIDNPDLFPDPFPEGSDDEENVEDDNDADDEEGDIRVHGLITRTMKNSTTIIGYNIAVHQTKRKRTREMMGTRMNQNARKKSWILIYLSRKKSIALTKKNK
ncbi:hypothetical protein B0H13DRAFT_2334978 [Mycena leptocephala]|nr:hypothetical protein B0H13DRAFT_2334978 [Mycena leptocephala]